MKIEKVNNTHYPSRVKLLKIINNKALIELTDNVIDTIETSDTVQLDTTIYTYDRLELKVPNRDNVVKFVENNFAYYWQQAQEYEPVIIENDKEKIARLEKEKGILEVKVNDLESELDALLGVE